MEQQLEIYKQKMIQDYNSRCNNADMQKEFANGIEIREGKKYYKVIGHRSVHSFIVKQDDAKFRKGDILKAASWAAPATNFARGNILEDFEIRWTGAL
tara:strand:- start:861 stop:1154 length:294 start_codon:yes stop_codon:yes gene_type:complete